ncbi:hypothetical protein FHX37_4220 [Haloactinospora alba]|uniref:Uncharacterized protein n=1 Tax=Haloactinospora alba TaxID=405555 RepID=A0A543N6P9_9ACTN|nr:hypothetical protein FHX37_4220 [Haloactinospora alba]
MLNQKRVVALAALCWGSAVTAGVSGVGTHLAGPLATAGLTVMVVYIVRSERKRDETYYRLGYRDGLDDALKQVSWQEKTEVPKQRGQS